jgi:hypothetical protein
MRDQCLTEALFFQEIIALVLWEGCLKRLQYMQIDRCIVDLASDSEFLQLRLQWNYRACANGC